MKLYDLIDKDLLEEMIEKQYINVQTHPELGYKIYSYSKSCSLNGVWNEATMQCRGLIVDIDNNIIARPFRKFFNIEEIADKGVIPNELPERIFEKKDGSLGIMYWDKDCHPYISTKGSFTSDQAKWATDFMYNCVLDIDAECELRELLLDFHSDPDEDGHDILDKVRYTLLFEIVYPEDRHVVDYGGEESITLLAIINNETGDELEPESLEEYFDVIKSLDVKEDWKKIREMYDGSNAEGFVAKFRNNFRVKLKYEDWFRKNFILHGLSKKRVVEFIINDDFKGFMSMVNTLNEENQIYYKKIYLEIMDKYHEIEYEAFREYREFDSDKEAAEYFKTCKYRSILFNIRRGKRYSDVIWKMIKEMVKERPENDEENEGKKKQSFR